MHVTFNVIVLLVRQLC